MRNVNNISMSMSASSAVACGFAVRPEEGQAGDPMFGRFCYVS